MALYKVKKAFANPQRIGVVGSQIEMDVKEATSMLQAGTLELISEPKSTPKVEKQAEKETKGRRGRPAKGK